MANLRRGEMELTITESNDEVHLYTLKLDGSRIVEIEELIGCGFIQALSVPEIRNGVKFLSAVLFYGLKHDPAGRKLTMSQVRNWLFGEELFRVSTFATQLAMTALPTQKDDDDPLDVSASSVSTGTP